MKNIKNNAGLGKLTILLNILIFVFFVISMIFLMKFDKINVNFVAETPSYLKAMDSLRIAEQPSRIDSAAVAHYTYRLDTLKSKPLPANPKDAKTYREELNRLSDMLKEKKDIQATNDSIFQIKKAGFAPIDKKYKDLESQKDNIKGTFSLFIYIVVFLSILKIFLFAFWNYRNLINLHNVASWMKKGTRPFWAFVGWLIPALNFVKPYSVFNEIWGETEYVLGDKDIKSDKKSIDSDFYLGLWWGLFLISIVLIPICLNSTFLGTGAMFYKLSHLNLVLASIVIWLLYVLLECFVIYKFNILNNQLFDNQDKL